MSKPCEGKSLDLDWVRMVEVALDRLPDNYKNEIDRILQLRHQKRVISRAWVL